MIPPIAKIRIRFVGFIIPVIPPIDYYALLIVLSHVDVVLFTALSNESKNPLIVVLGISANPFIGAGTISSMKFKLKPILFYLFNQEKNQSSSV